MNSSISGETAQSTGINYSQLNIEKDVNQNAYVCILLRYIKNIKFYGSSHKCYASCILILKSEPMFLPLKGLLIAESLCYKMENVVNSEKHGIGVQELDHKNYTVPHTQTYNC